MKISNRRLRKIRKIKNQTRKRNKSYKRRHKKGGKRRSFRRKNYVNLRRQTLKCQRGGTNGDAAIKTILAQADKAKVRKEELQKSLRDHSKRKFTTKTAQARSLVHQKSLARQIKTERGKEKNLKKQANGLLRLKKQLRRSQQLRQQRQQRQGERKKQQSKSPESPTPSLGDDRRALAQGIPQGMPHGEDEEDQQLQQQQARIDYAITGLSPDDLQPDTTAAEELAEMEKEQAEQEKQAAPKIQRVVRGHKGRKKARAVRRQRTAVKKIQRVVRGHKGRKKARAVRRQRTAVKKIQRVVRGHKGRKRAQGMRAQRRQQSATQVPNLPDITPAPLGTIPPVPPPTQPAPTSHSVPPSISPRQAAPPAPAVKLLSEQLREQKLKLRRTQKRSRSKIARGLNHTQRRKWRRLRFKTKSKLTKEEKVQLRKYTRKHKRYIKAVKDSRKKGRERWKRRQQKEAKRKNERKKAALATRTKAVMGRMKPSGRGRTVSKSATVSTDDTAHWIKLTDKQGHAYWHNPQTGKSSWTSPAEKRATVPAKGLSEVLRQKREREQDEKQRHDRAPTASRVSDDSGLLSHDIDHQYQLLKNYIDGIREVIVKVKMPDISGPLTQADLDRRRQAYLTFLQNAGLENWEQLVGIPALRDVKSSSSAKRVLQMKLRLIEIKSRVERARRGDDEDDDPASAGGGGRERMPDHERRQRPEYKEEATQAFCALFSTTENPKPNTFNMEKLCSIVKLTQVEADHIRQQRVSHAVAVSAASAADATETAAAAAAVAHQRQRGHLDETVTIGNKLAKLQKKLAGERQDLQKLHGARDATRAKLKDAGQELAKTDKLKNKKKFERLELAIKSEKTSIVEKDKAIAAKEASIKKLEQAIREAQHQQHKHHTASTTQLDNVEEQTRHATRAATTAASAHTVTRASGAADHIVAQSNRDSKRAAEAARRAQQTRAAAQKLQKKAPVTTSPQPPDAVHSDSDDDTDEEKAEHPEDGPDGPGWKPPHTPPPTQPTRRMDAAHKVIHGPKPTPSQPPQHLTPPPTRPKGKKEKRKPLPPPPQPPQQPPQQPQQPPPDGGDDGDGDDGDGDDGHGDDGGGRGPHPGEVLIHIRTPGRAAGAQIDAVPRAVAVVNRANLNAEEMMIRVATAAAGRRGV